MGEGGWEIGFSKEGRCSRDEGVEKEVVAVLKFHACWRRQFEKSKTMASRYSAGVTMKSCMLKYLLS
jgi:hypothetical protein